MAIAKNHSAGKSIMTLGKKYRRLPIGKIPNDYLDWIINEDWAWEANAKLMEAIQTELLWRKNQNVVVES